MKLPQYIYGSNEDLQRYFSLLVQQLQGSLTEFGWSAPPLTPAEIATVTSSSFTPVLPPGTFWWNSSIQHLQVITVQAVPGVSNATYKTIAYNGDAPFPWTIVAGDTLMAVNNGYITSSGGMLMMTLPTTAAVGDIIEVTNVGGNFSIRQSIGQTINFGIDVTTPGVMGHIDSMNIGDTIELVCYNANTGFQVISSMGNLTIV